MNKTQLKIWILKVARKRIKDGHNDYICTAVSEAIISYIDHEVFAAKLGIRLAIEQSLGDHYTLEDWVRAHYSGTYQMSSENFRQARLAWIDDMTDALNKNLFT